MIRKFLKRAFVTIASVAIVLCSIPFNAIAATSNEATIFNFLVGSMGLNTAAACGVLANIEYESDFNPNLYGDNGTSYGICQWHNTRFTNLRNYCDKNGYDWKSINGQLNFLKYELTYLTQDTGSTLKKLKAVSNTADGAYEAASAWCYNFEIPANISYEANKRGTRAKTYYWPKYANNNIGDVNSDGKINSDDALMVLNYAVKKGTLNSTQIKAADMNKDNKVNSQDALLILNVVTGKVSINNYK
ncbi:MAG: hypothetical protein KBT46_07860 [Ruminococcus sp.]|nr:hypothetical protein [Candidatus Copronaster equi]